MRSGALPVQSPARVIAGIALVLASCTPDDVDRADAGTRADAGRVDAGGEPRDGGSDGGAIADAGPRVPRATFERITDRHRFVPGAMFGGWGPHLGHLVREGGAIFWVDDLCDQGVAGDCDANVDRRVGVFRREAGTWTSVATIPLSGVQQNTGTLAQGGALRTYGVDVIGSRVVECTTTIASGASACASLPFPLGAYANYVGAAISPAGARVVWWTNVVDGGGGSFSYLVDYGGGWNGPRTGPVGGYNDCAYVAAAFGAGGTLSLTFFGQVVSGRAPAWAFSTLVGEADLTTSDPASWANVLAPPAGDAIASTNDLWIDDVTGDAHLLARAESGAVVYYHRPEGASFGAGAVIEPSSYRARFVVTARAIAIASGPNAGGLRARLFDRSATIAGSPLDVASAIVHELALPDGLGPIVGIYPEATIYQEDDVAALDLALVASGRENEAWYVEIEP